MIVCYKCKKLAEDRRPLHGFEISDGVSVFFCLDCLTSICADAVKDIDGDS